MVQSGGRHVPTRVPRSVRHPFSRFDAKLEQRIAEVKAELRQEIAEVRSGLAGLEGRLLARLGVLEGRFGTLEGRLVKWMFLFWAGAWAQPAPSSNSAANSTSRGLVLQTSDHDGDIVFATPIERELDQPLT